MFKTIKIVAMLIAIGLSYDMSPVVYDMAPDVSYEFSPDKTARALEAIGDPKSWTEPEEKPIAAKKTVYRRPTNRWFPNWRR
jgi:hypothetical protein